MDSLLSEAKYYRETFGMSVIPVNGKKATGSWKPFQHSLPDDEQLAQLFDKAHTGIAVITGQVSRGLVIRDFDKDGAYQEWRTRNPALAERLPTVESSPGRFHVYGRVEGDEKTKTFPDGEFRAKGAYTLIPPSIHPSGAEYRWVDGIPDSIPLLSPAEVLVLRCPAVGASIPKPKGYLAKSAGGAGAGVAGDADAELAPASDGLDTPSLPNQATHQLNAPVCVNEDGFVAILAEVMSRTQPQAVIGPKTSTYRAAIFEYVRHLKHELPGLTMPQKVYAASEWHKVACGSEGELETVITDFGVAWKNAKPELHWNKLLEEYEKQELPDCYAALGGKYGQLIRLCIVLQDHFGEKPFFLSCRKAASVVKCAKEDKNINHTQANKQLNALEGLGILTRVETGSFGHGKNKATSWRYNAPV